MKPIIQFVRTTLLGGVFFLLPIVVLVIFLGKVTSLAVESVKPLANYIPADWSLGLPKEILLAVAVLVLLCFVAGLLARTKLSQELAKGLERSVLSKIPAYEYFRQVSASTLGFSQLGQHPVILVRLDVAWQIGIQVEGEKNGFVTVYVPSTPDPRAGAVYFLGPDRIRPTTVPIVQAMNCLKRFGAGSSALFGAQVR
jgi:uncharacterized membrane protein